MACRLQKAHTITYLDKSHVPLMIIKKFTMIPRQEPGKHIVTNVSIDTSLFTTWTLKITLS